MVDLRRDGLPYSVRKILGDLHKTETLFTPTASKGPGEVLPQSLRASDYVIYPFPLANRHLFTLPLASSCDLLLAARGVVPNANSINDNVVSAAESRCYADIHVFRNFLATKVTRDYGPFTQPCIDDLIQLGNRKVACSLRTDIIQGNEPIVAHSVDNPVVAIAQMLDHFAPLSPAVELPLAESQQRRLKDVVEYQKERRTFLR